MRITLLPLYFEETIQDSEIEVLFQSLPNQQLLQVGSMVRFLRQPECWGQVIMLKRPYNHPEKLMGKLRILHGKPGFHPQDAEVFFQQDLPWLLELLLQTIRVPLEIASGVTVGDLRLLGSLTTLRANSIVVQADVLTWLLTPLVGVEKVLFLDAAGISRLNPGFMDQESTGLENRRKPLPWQQYPLGLMTDTSIYPELRLSIQQLGPDNFIRMVACLLPDTLQPQAIDLLSKRTPATPDFIPFRHYLRPDKYEEIPAKSPLLHLLFRLHDQKLFADEEEQVFSWSTLIRLASGTMRSEFRNQAERDFHALDLSALPVDWREFLCRLWLRQWFSHIEETAHGVLIISGLEVSVTEYQQYAAQAELSGKHLIFIHHEAHQEETHLPLLPSGFNRIDAIDLPGLAKIRLRLEGPLTGGVIVQGILGQPFETVRELYEKKDLGIQPDERLTGNAPEAYPEMYMVDKQPQKAVEIEDVPDVLSQAQGIETQENNGDEFEFRNFPFLRDETLPTPSSSFTSSQPIKSQQESDADNSYPDVTVLPEDRLPETRLESLSHSEIAYQEREKALDDIFGREERDFFFEMQSGPHSESSSDWVNPLSQVFPPDNPSGHPYQVLSVTSKEEEFSLPLDPLTEPLPISEEDMSSASSLKRAFPSEEVALVDSQSRVPVYPTFDGSMEGQMEGRQDEFREGEAILHEKYGHGVIERIIPIDDRITLKVVFESVGKRLLDADTSPIRKA